MAKRTTSELDIMVGSLKEHINEKFTDMNGRVDSLTVQVKMTNGTVKNLQLWRSFILGALAIIWCAVVPLIIYVYFLNAGLIKKDLSQALDDKLSQYNVQVIK